MIEWFQKLKRIEPLVKIKKEVMDQEALQLASLQSQKEQAAQILNQFKDEYVVGLQKLNDVRQSEIRSSLEIMESSLSYTREQWVRAYRNLQLVEKKIDVQVKVLQTAQKKLKAFEVLAQNYSTEYQKAVNKNDQSHLDEHVLRQYTTQKGKAVS